MTTNLKAFLKMISVSEGTAGLGDDGYNVVVGGTLFYNYGDHPRKRVWIERIKNFSTAAGRYQIMQRYFDAYKEQLHLPDFSPASQDAIAVQMIKECKATQDIEEGRIEAAIAKCKSRWASFPGAGYGQAENKMAKLIKAYTDAGGNLV